MLHFNLPLVHMAPAFLSLSSSSVTAKKFPEAMGVYKLSKTTRESHQLVGYFLKEGFYLFKDYSQPTSQFVTKVPFSRKEDDLILSKAFHYIKHVIFHTFRTDIKKIRFIVHLFLSENIFAKPSQEK